MKRISRDHHQFRFDPQLPPVARLRPGESILLETWDARAGRMERPDQAEAAAPDPALPFPNANPVTGPLFIEGAEPGMMLRVRIDAIDVAGRGWSLVKTSTGIGHERFSHTWARFFSLSEAGFRFAGRRLPLRPMVGTIGTAPAGQAVGTVPAGRHGGNMDNRRAAPGALVYLPVFAPGGLLSLGDVHASMGDGEVSGVALETAAEVAVTVDLIDDWTGPLSPFIDTGDLWVAAGFGDDLDTAVSQAVTTLAEDLAWRLEISFSEAVMLISLAGDVAACQCADAGKLAGGGAGERRWEETGTTTARAEIPTFWR